MEAFKVAAVQLSAGLDTGDNLVQAEALVADAAGTGAQMVALPELFCWGGRQNEEPAAAETIPGPTSRRLGRLAAKLGIYLSAGSLLEKSGDGKLCFNTAPLFGPDGSLLACYRKIHLFSVDMPGRATVDETASRKHGELSVCITTNIARIGMSICYDLRFPELFRHLAADGAELILLPSAFTKPTGEAHWHTLVATRAIENQCYVVAANQWGKTTHGFDNYGHSLIVDPWGEVLAEAAGEGSTVLTAELDPERLAEVRSRLPALRHRRLGL